MTRRRWRFNDSLWLRALLLSLLGFSGSAFCQDPRLQKLAEGTLDAGKKFYDDGQYQSAVDTLAHSNTLFEQLNDLQGQVRSLNLQAENYSNLGKCDDAKRLLLKSLEINGRLANDNKTGLAETYYYFARLEGGCARRFGKADSLMRISTSIKRKLHKEDDPELAFNYTFMGYIFNSQGKFDSALHYLNQALAIRSKHLGESNIETSHTLFYLANTYEGKSELGTALDLHLRALTIRKANLGNTHATLSNSFNSLGRIYRRLGNHDRALEYHRQALEIRKQTLGAEHPNVAGSYYEIGNLLGTISNYYEAIEYIQQGNRILEANALVSQDVLATYFAYAGKMHGLTGDHKQARLQLQKGISLAEKTLAKDHPYRAVVYNIAGEYYADVADVARQAEFFEKALAIYRRSYGQDSEREADILTKMADAYANAAAYDKATSLFRKALEIYNQKLGEKNPKGAGIHLALGDMLAKRQEFAGALLEYELALKVISSNPFKSKSKSRMDEIESKPLAFRIERSKARLLFIQAKAGAIDTLLLRRSLASYEFAISLAEEINSTYVNEKSRIQAEKESRALYGETMDALWLLYQASAAQSVVKSAFIVSEKSKSALLFESTRDIAAKTLAGVPDSLVDQERDVKIELAYYKTNLYQAQKSNDTIQLAALEKNIFDTQRKLDNFKKRLERSFPSYFKSKYEDEHLDIAQLQILMRDPATALVEYFVGDTSIYRFTLSALQVEFDAQSRNAKFQEYLSSYERSITDIDYILNEPASADALYRESAFQLRQMLLPTLPPTTTNKLIIVPDDILAQVNFGTLLVDKAKVTEDYLSLSYLSGRHSISYAYSARLLPGPSEKRKSTTRSFAGFAPSYAVDDYANLDSASHPLTYVVVRSGRLPLPGALEEVKAVSTMMSGSMWLDQEATETNFKQNAGEFDILHLAMHSLLNNEEPGYSELLFNSRTDKTNDGYLTVSEIYNLKLRAQMVVLSACSSGYGKIQSGEGPISISRAFSYAGCPSVVMSLWKIPDGVTAKLMQNFYEELKKGYSKDEALRVAQYRFLRETDDPLYRHPYFWAGFVVMGDAAPLQSPLNVATLFYLSGSAVMVLALIAWFRRKSRRQSMASSN